MATFAERYGYSKKHKILEEAPLWLRTRFTREVLSYFLIEYPDVGDIDLEFLHPDDFNLFHEGIIHNYSIIDIKIKLKNDFLDSADFFTIIHNCEWDEFYSIIEIIGEEIKSLSDYYIEKYRNLTSEDIVRFFKFYKGNKETYTNLTPDNIDDFRILPAVPTEIMDFSWLEIYVSKKYTFTEYRNRVNSLFNECNVGWNLDETSQFKTTTSPILENKIQEIGDELISSFSSAYNHFQKANRYAFRRPLDPENSIKEIVSALESLGRTLYPHANNLSGVVIEMRRADILPQRLLEVIKAFYHYACDEPGIRHGKSENSKVRLEDAEFCLHLGAALIHYMVTAHGQQDSLGSGESE